MSEGKAALTEGSIISVGYNNGFTSADCHLKEYRNLMKIKKGTHFLYLNSPCVMSYAHLCSEVTAVRVDITLVW
jgi:hypothetical protein